MSDLDLLGNPVRVITEPPHPEDLLTQVLEHCERIPVQVVRGGKAATRYLDQVNAREAIEYCREIVRTGQLPVVEYKLKKRQGIDIAKVAEEAMKVLERNHAKKS